MIRVLIVDDREEGRYLLGTLLKSQGYDVEVASQGAEALSKAGQNPPQLVISDLLMPVMDGYTLLRHWRADPRFGQIPFIVYTATYTDPIDEQLALDLGADAFILKPTEPEDFITRIQQVLAHQAERGRQAPGEPAAEARTRIPIAAPIEEEMQNLRQYSRVLIDKLEDKMEEADKANRELQRDIAERKQVEEALRQARDHMEVRVQERTAELQSANETLERTLAEGRSREQEIQRLNRQLELRLAELESVNRELESFAYSVSHDLRTPLRSINGFSRALLEDYADKLDEAGKQNLQIILASSQRMGRLIDDLMGLSQVTRTRLTRERINLAALAQSVVDELKRSDPARLVVFVSPPSLPAQADPNLLRIVLQNLLANAWKFTSKKDQARIELGQSEGSEETTFFVRDNGAGFEMAYADKLFSAFQRLHSAAEFPGTGIGLAIVQRIIHRHGGRVWAEAEPEKGACFYFTLPVSAQETTA